MKREELHTALSSNFQFFDFPEINTEILNAVCPANKLIEVGNKLKSDELFGFDFLFSLTAIDREDHLEVIYHLRSSEHGHELVLRVNTEGRENPQIETVCAIWPTAEFHEREVFDLFGISFNNHPDLRRIFLEDDWEGYPLRKDYTDDINIVEL